MKVSSFLGSGWAFPPSFSPGGDDVRMSTGEKDIRQSLRILLTTQVGERIMREDFGCSLNELQFEVANHKLYRDLENMITEAIKKYEPRIKLENLDISEKDNSEGELLITLDYTLRATNARHNMVFPFYLNEATLPIDQF